MSIKSTLNLSDFISLARRLGKIMVIISLFIYQLTTITNAVGPSTIEFEVSVFKEKDKVWIYKKLEIQGWDIYVADYLNIHSVVMTEILKQVEIGLKHINSNVPKIRTNQLKQFPIWIDNQPNYPDFRPGENAQIPFHDDADWLRKYNMNPTMEWGVHIINPFNIIHSSKHFYWQPHVLLHELSHGLNLRIMTKQEQLDVTIAFENAKAKKLYRNVERKWINTGKSETQRIAYAMSNEGEYFAELTEAYFGFNETFPFDRKQLENYDPTGFKLIKESWLDTSSENDKKITSSLPTF